MPPDKPRVREATEAWLTFAKEQQKALGLSQAKIADGSGVSEPTISELWRGIQTTSEHLSRIEKVLGMKSIPPEWELVAHLALRDGYYEQLMTWLELGLRAQKAGALRIAYSVVEQIVLPRENPDLETSAEFPKRPAPLPIVTEKPQESPSDPRATKGHGQRKPRAR